MSDPRRASGPPLRPASGQRLRIAGIEYDPEDRSFTRRGERLPLVGKPLELAEYLLASGSRTHGIAELKDAVWRGTAVSDNSVYKAVSKVRDALGPGVISTRRKLGFQLAAAPVSAAPPLTLPDAARAPLGDDGPFVGQEVLLADLVRHLDAARAGRGRLVCLRGETGAGKTRVAAELARLGREAGVEAHWGGFADPAAGAQRHPWQEIAASVRARAGSDEPPTRVYGVDLAAEGPAAFADAAIEALSRAAAVAPRLLLIDDAQWTDPEAAQRIHAIAERLANLPTMLLVLIRSPGLAGAAPEEHLGRIERLAADSLTVPSLREEDVRALVLHALGEASADALAEEIRRRTDGNAYFATELIRWIRNAGEHPELRDARVLPETIRSAIESRLAVLPRRASEILCYAATVGHEIDLALLRRSRRWTAAELSEAVALFEREGLLRRIDPDDPEELRFEHHLVQEVAALRLAGRPEEIHWEIGEIAEELYGDALAASTLVARHMARGVEVGDARRAVAALRRAALASMRAFAHGRAAEHLRAALRITRRQAGAQRERAEILLELGRALLRAGSLEEAAQAFQDTAQIAEALGEPTLLGRAALGFSGAATTVGGAHGPALELVRTALRKLGGGEEALRVRLQSREALLEDALGRQDSAAGLAETAVALAEALRDPKGLATAYRVRNTVGVSRVHDAGPRVAFATKTLDFAVASGDVSLEVDALIHRGVAELHRGAVSAARRDFREARGSLRDRPPTSASYPVEVASVLLAVLDGELGLAGERVESAYALGRKVGHADARLYRDIQRFQLAYLHGSLAELGESGLAEVAAKSPLLGVRVVAALMHAEADRIRPVRPILGRLVEEAAEAARDTGWLSNLSLLALAAARVRDERSAAELRGLLDPYEPYVVSAFCVVSNGPVPLFLGLLDGVLGNTERARRHLRDAVSRNEEMRIEPWLCLSKIALAECAHDTDDPDAEAALHHARGARRLAQDMGMRRAEERAAAVLRRLGGELATPLDPSEL